jgi:two-component sensor histidine kinase
MSLTYEITKPVPGINSNGNAEADHRIANHLAMLASYIRLKGAGIFRSDHPPNENDLRCLMSLVVAQIDAISALHRILSVEGNPDALCLSDSLSRMCAAMNASVASEADIAQTCEEACEIASQSILPATQICAEIITNALKHGRNANGLAIIRVACRKSSAGTVVVEISDNGPGLSDRSKKTGEGGLGNRLIEALVRQVDGRIDYLSTSRGLTVRFALPAAHPMTCNGAAKRGDQAGVARPSSPTT